MPSQAFAEEREGNPAPKRLTPSFPSPIMPVMENRQVDDEHWMRRALELAATGTGRVEPNPCVGAVIVKDGRVVGEGFHERFGGPHAEVNVMQAAGDACADSTLYVTLAPCTGRAKKTPPCCDAVIRAAFRRVVIGALDPTQEPAVPLLESAGIEVIHGVLAADCERLIAPFLKLHTLGKPYVIAKWAMTADGKIATATGDSKWISCEASREQVHQWRNQVDAVLVGIGTVRHDDPLLTCRIPGGRNPRRIVLDSHAGLALTSRLVATAAEAPLLVACLDSAPEAACRELSDAGCTVIKLKNRGRHVDADALLSRLGDDQITNLMVEGGGTVLAHFFEHELVDEVRVFIAPKVIGGAAAPSPLMGRGISSMADALKLSHVRWTPVGDDMLMTGVVG